MPDSGCTDVPLIAPEDLLAVLPDDREVVAYCRGPFCVYADEAVRLPMRRGCVARRFVAGR